MTFLYLARKTRSDNKTRKILTLASSAATLIASFGALFQAFEIGFVIVNDQLVSIARYADYAIATPSTYPLPTEPHPHPY